MAFDYERNIEHVDIMEDALVDMGLLAMGDSDNDYKANRLLASLHKRSYTLVRLVEKVTSVAPGPAST